MMIMKEKDLVVPGGAIIHKAQGNKLKVNKMPKRMEIHVMMHSDIPWSIN
jgi:hypothetical protein